jgi:hypothetical protein
MIYMCVASSLHVGIKLSTAALMISIQDVAQEVILLTNEYDYIYEDEILLISSYTTAKPNDDSVD